MSYRLETGHGGIAVTPDTPFSVARGLWVGTAGNVEVRFPAGGTAIFYNVTGLLPVNAIEVVASGTTATNITAIL